MELIISLYIEYCKYIIIIINIYITDIIPNCLLCNEVKVYLECITRHTDYVPNNTNRMGYWIYKIAHQSIYLHCNIHNLWLLLVLHYLQIPPKSLKSMKIGWKLVTNICKAWYSDFGCHWRLMSWVHMLERVPGRGRLHGKLRYRIKIAFSVTNHALFHIVQYAISINLVSVFHL